MTPFFIALQFLTRLKIVNQTEWSVEDFGKSVVAFPYVGLIIGLILALLYGILSPFIPLVPLMLILVIAEFLITGGLHADGLMDTSDGLFSGRERDRKLEIMKDSRYRIFWCCCFCICYTFKMAIINSDSHSGIYSNGTNYDAINESLVPCFEYSILSLCTRAGDGGCIR